MQVCFCAMSQEKWAEYNLASFDEFADRVECCLMGEDRHDWFGRWYFVPEEPLPNGFRVIYSGLWSGSRAPDDPMNIVAEIYDVSSPEGQDEFAQRVSQWKSLPRRLDEWIG